jgi:tRNA(fMet)-specific endonuclease VapC
MLDTNIVIYLRQGKHPKVSARFQHMTLGSTVMSIITSGELYFGVAKSERPKEAREAVDLLLDRIPPLTMELDVARRYAALRFELAATTFGLRRMPCRRSSFLSRIMSVNFVVCLV